MQSSPKRLLVVDDEPDILEFLQIILKEEGYEVVSSNKGEYLEQTLWTILDEDWRLAKYIWEGSIQ